MPRNAIIPAFFVALVSIVSGCAKPTAKVEADYTVPEAPPAPELFAVDPAGSAVMPEAGSSTSTYNPPGSSSGNSAAGNSDLVVASSGGPNGGATTHRVARGDTLYSLARKYYNDPKRWKTILDANRDAIPSPKALPVGRTLVIP